MSNPIERLTNSVIGGDSKKAALIVSETNLYYLTAFPSTDGALLLTSEQAYYLLDFRYTEAAPRRKMWRLWSSPRLTKPIRRF